MTEKSNYHRIALNNLRRFYEDLDADAAVRMGAEEKAGTFFLRAFGRRCIISPDGITLDGQPETAVRGVLISLYALHADPAPCIAEPFKSFRELPDSMPYAAAFLSRTQQPLIAHVETIADHLARIVDAVSGSLASKEVVGDFAFLLHPLPKIALRYQCYQADEDFPASVACLYSANAAAHLPTDALADLGEHTTREILHLIGK